MTEIPEHLLQRTRSRRQALGLPVSGEGGGSEGGGGGAITPARGRRRRRPRRGAALPRGPVAPSGPVERHVPPPRPDPPYVQAYKARKKIPVWALPGAAGAAAVGRLLRRHAVAPALHHADPGRGGRRAVRRQLLELPRLDRRRRRGPPARRAGRCWTTSPTPSTTCTGWSPARRAPRAASSVTTPRRRRAACRPSAPPRRSPWPRSSTPCATSGRRSRARPSTRRRPRSGPGSTRLVTDPDLDGLFTEAEVEEILTEMSEQTGIPIEVKPAGLSCAVPSPMAYARPPWLITGGRAR